jgi:hypothetical protein
MCSNASMDWMTTNMDMPKPSRPRTFIALGLIVLLGAAACTPSQSSSPSPTAFTPLAVTATATACEQKLVPPEIREILPAEPIAGSEIMIIGSGGYLQDTCGGFIEGARSFKLYLDREPLGDLSCYINRCEGKVTLPNTIPSGVHCLSAEPDKCQFEFQIMN